MKLKSIELDNCNGMENITISGTGTKPEIIPGTVVALCHKKIHFNVLVKSYSESKVTFVGIVLSSDTNNLDSCRLKQDDEIVFSYENICYPTRQ